MKRLRKILERESGISLLVLTFNASKLAKFDLMGNFPLNL